MTEKFPFIFALHLKSAKIEDFHERKIVHTSTTFTSIPQSKRMGWTSISYVRLPLGKYRFVAKLSLFHLHSLDYSFCMCARDRYLCYPRRFLSRKIFATIARIMIFSPRNRSYFGCLCLPKLFELTNSLELC